MSPWKLAATIPLLCALSLASCARDDPEAALQAAAERLQASLESKQTSALMELLHADFQAQRQYDRDWARRTAMLGSVAVSLAAAPKPVFARSKA